MTVIHRYLEYLVLLKSALKPIDSMAIALNGKPPVSAPIYQAINMILAWIQPDKATTSIPWYLYKAADLENNPDIALTREGLSFLHFFRAVTTARSINFKFWLWAT